MTKAVLKWSKWLSLCLLSLCVVLVVLVAILMFTSPGLKLAVWGAHKALPELSIGEAQGALLPSFSLHNVEYHNPDLNLDAKVERLSLALNLSCLSEPSLCVDNLSLRGLDVNLPELPVTGEDSEQAQSDEPLGSITAPLPVRVQRLALANINLNLLGNQVSWKQLVTGAEFSGNLLRLKPTEWRDIALRLAPSDAESEEPPAVNPPTSTSPRQPLVLPEVTLPLQVEVPSFVIESFRLEQDPSPLEINQLKLAVSAKQQSINLKQLDVTMPQGTASVKGNATLKGDYPLNLQINAKVEDPMAKGQKLAVSATGSVADLTLNADLSGPAHAKLNAHVEALKANVPFELSLSDVNAQWPLVGESEYQLQRTQAQIQGNLDGYQLSLNSEIDGAAIPAIKAKLNGQGDDQHIVLSELNVDSLGGHLKGSAKADWAKLVNWQAQLELTDIQPGLQWPQAEGSISGQLRTQGHLTADNGWQVSLPELNIQGVLRDYPLTIQGEAHAQDLKGNGNIEIDTPKLVLAHGPNQLIAKGKLDHQWQMDVNVDFPDLAKTVPDLTGQVAGDIKLEGAMQEPDVGLNLAVESVTWQNQASVEKITLNGQVKPMPTPQGKLALTIDNAKYEDIDVSEATLDFNGGQSQHQVRFDLASNLVSTSLALNGKLQLDPNLVWSGELERATIESKQGEWRLNHATPLAYNGKKVQVSVGHHCWRQDDSALCLDKDLTAGSSGQATLRVEQFNFNQLAMFIPDTTKIEGSVDADLWAKWTPQNPPQLKAQVTLPQGKVTQKADKPVTLGWDSMAFNAQIQNNKLMADWDIQVTDNGDLNGKLTIPDLKVENKQLDGELNLSRFSLAFLSPLLGPYSQLDSVLSADVDISGPMMQPKVLGQIKIEDLLFEGDVAPVEVKSGDIVLDLSGYQAKLSAKINTPDGQLNVDGDADWQNLNAWDTQVHVFADDLKVDYPPMVKVQVQPDMTIAVTPQHAKIDGKINLPWGRIMVEELPPSAIGVSKDQVLLDESLQPINDSDKLPFDIETNIDINIGDDFKLSAFGLNSGLKGSLKVAQKDRGPLVNGEINIVDGSYTSFGQDLLIREGKILMNGPVDQPYVDITAVRNPETTQDDVVAGVKVTGPADEPQMTIFSDPAMPQANALSYLLRGQDIDSESGGSAMTTALIGLSLAQSGKVVGEIGEAFGVQDLQLDTEGAGDDSQVTVSGYILPGLQVKYGVGIFDSVGEFTVRYRLMQDLYVEAVSGLDSAVDLLYQFEFD